LGAPAVGPGVVRRVREIPVEELLLLEVGGLALGGQVEGEHEVLAAAHERVHPGGDLGLPQEERGLRDDRARICGPGTAVTTAVARPVGAAVPGALVRAGGG